MYRLFFRFLLLLLAFAFLRYVITTIARAFSQPMNPTPASPEAKTAAGAIGGELKQDPVCGTFVPVGTSVNKTVNGELVYFCSAACRDKFFSPQRR